MKLTLDNAESSLPSDEVSDSASLELVQSLLRLVRIARHRKKTLIQAACLGAILGAGYYVLAPRYYESTAELLIIQRNRDQIPMVGDQAGADNVMTTYQKLVTSSVVIQDAIEHVLPEHRVDFQTKPPHQWRENIAERLSASTTRKTNIMRVSYRSLDPEAASAVVSAVIQSYLNFVEQTHHGTAAEVIDLLTRERESSKRELAAKQQQLQSFRQQMGHIASSSDADIVEPMIQRALRLNDALMTAQEERMELQASLTTIRVAKRNSDDLRPHFAALEKVVGNEMMSAVLGLSPQDMTMIHDQEKELLKAQAKLQSLTAYYGPAHPHVTELNERIRNIEQYLASYRANANQRMAALSNAELGPMLESMLQESLDKASLKEQQLLASFNAARAEASQQSGAVLQLQMLEHEVARLERMDDALQTKIKSIDMTQLQGPIQATVVQEPLPNELPVSPNLRLVAMASLVGALAVGGLIAYVQDVLDDRFTSPEDISAQLGVPVLTIVRDLETLEGNGLQAVHSFIIPTAAETEAFRTLRTALTLSNSVSERILISSSEPGDGKTTIAANLAVSFAQAGKRTLLIDADLRKPGLTTLMGLKGQAGMADVLSSEEGPAKVAERWIQKTELPGLDVLPAGLRRPNPAELLGGENFVELLAWADSCYDQVLIDCPPVLAVSDAQVVGRLIDGAILVVRPDKNHRRLVVRACDAFTTTGSTVLGVVANGLSAEGRGYGYGYDYGYGYGYGHDTADSTGGGEAESEGETSEAHEVLSFRTRSQVPRDRSQAA